MSALRILQLFPELTNVNGDAENALVLARRLQWAGIDAEVVPLAAGDPVPTAAPAAVFLGSGTDSSLVRTLAALDGIRGALSEWLAADIPLLAVGTGLELLGRRIDLPEGPLEGLGMVPGEASFLPARVAGDLVVDSVWGRLLGYENHGRGFALDSGVTPLGRVAAGTGNGDGADGVALGSLYGTHLHGPVLARNPAMAMAFVAAAAPGTGVDAYARGRADGVADAINAATLRRLQL
ncbi:type 1 glutamine amidotransferase [Naasia aerilata]|uniref:Lipid II isoglutaminyl synthase (glutamine-hydrolyzing) subunit GatD n=1 Tax=Naasia aerilata TaxID=1162966 RepID=A0ABM8GEQ4_9MICO|nr:cobyric acid synthase [Naasia aerilata]BDZ46821.1 glutamine amidotransferase [Naasia aerilata]